MNPSRGKLSDCRSNSHDTLRGGMPSPRVSHFDGEIPPALSPLDAFAAQGRFLARQLDESRLGERRMSRLPPSSVARSLSRPRPGYFRSPKSDSNTQELTRRPTQKGQPEVEEPKYRPVSEHPRFSSVSHASSNYGSIYYDDDDDDNETTPRTTMIQEEPGEYGIPRAQSPDAESMYADDTEGISVGQAFTGPSRQSSTDSRLHIPRTLAPPVSPHSRPSSSARVNQLESSDDDYSSSNAGSTFSKPRKLSSGSAVSLPYSPMSTFPARTHPRSPSMSSETSTGTGYLARPSFNFSRPLSRSSTSLSAPGASESAAPTPQLQTSLPHQSSHMHRPSKPAPILLPLATEEAAATRPVDGEPSSAVSSFVYAKYALPRGRELGRDSVVFAGLQTPHFEWQEPLFENSPPRRSEDIPRSARTPPPPTTFPQVDHSPKPHSMHEVPAPEPQPAQPAQPAQPTLPTTPEPKRTTLVPEVSPRPPSAQTLTTPEKPEKPSRPSTESTRRQASEKAETVSSADSASTLRPQTATTQVPSTADDHVTKGIELHEKGSLNESTYHFRIAAKQNHPTGMLMYALACRSGWGMRPNQQEGVRWLRKAVDSVGLEMLENPDALGASKAKELQKAYRAQFALSIYELGVSHLNGWGIDQDKSLALRCFEIAGQWGDVDAMAEAGFCYAEGVGCKKDMKKAARFYRQAESNGMSMVGNSWIYKDKYMGEEPGKESKEGRSRGRTVSGDKKNPRNKSRTRSIFQRKKSVPE
ncbi:Tetratricopeptide-like helical [Penicillium malachiteum]|uniref:Tetratricopeptide-like helical n=1 Tax=Penicillium malachiteum TaxID=1324776 RepID=UPI002547A6C0|nr:Tetratricopeptide-like helical [Penicillium malachiteum]KAJ5721503.1 Tetratricopeptide-like helical [Penicillium malachiteum]